ncbi:CPBP family intramembrane glutamic endopeptidase [Natrialbaceae archaeon A-gly3]
MTDTAGSVEKPGGAAVVTALGFVLTGLAMAGLLSPVSRGVDDPALLAALGLAIVATVVFVGRRHGGIDRQAGAPVAGVAALAVVALSAYVLNQGIYGETTLPLVGSVPLVLGSFLAAFGALGMAVADYGDVSADGLKRRTILTVSLSAVGVIGLLGAVVVTFLLSVPAYAIFGEFTETQLTALNQFGMAIGTAAVAVGYLEFSDRGVSFLDLEVPTKWDVAWIVGGVVVLFGTLLAISTLLTSAGLEGAEHGTAQQAQDNPEILLVMIPASILIIGPFEELLFRNVIQKAMYGTFSRAGAVVVASVLFAAVHAPAYGTDTAGAVLVSLGVVFGLSIVLGAIYERTENVLVPGFVHGIYNAVLFASMYASMV